MSGFLYNRIKILMATSLGFLMLFSVFADTLLAATNQEINYQGKLTDTGGVAVADGTYNMNFWLLASSTSATSTAIWSEARTDGDRVQVTNGLFSVMLGEVSSLAGVDFNQTLYLGVEIGGTGGTPSWDGEMSPRKVIGSVPAAFVAETANTFDGYATTSFLRADDADTMEATSSSALLTVTQNGSGDILNLFAGTSEMFTVLNNGNVGIGTTTPSAKLSVVGEVQSEYFNATSTTATSTFSGSITGVNDLLKMYRDGSNNPFFQFGNLTGPVPGDSNTSFIFGGTVAQPHTIGSNTYLSGLWGGYDNILGDDTYATHIVGSNHSSTTGTHNMIAGGSYHSVSDSDYGSVFGGTGNSVKGNYTVIAGGSYNTASSTRGTVIGSTGNSVYATGAGIFSSNGSTIDAGSTDAVILGGTTNTIDDSSTYKGVRASIIGGSGHTISNGDYSAILGGFQSTVGHRFAAVLGGRSNEASGEYSLAAGRRAKATASGAFALSDATDADFSVGTANVFGSRFSGGYWLTGGGVGIGTTTTSAKLTVGGDGVIDGSLTITDALKDTTNATGTSGQILSSTGTSTLWTSTSGLGLGDGTFLGLTDTISSYTANRLLFTNSGGTAVTDSANLVFDGTSLGIGTTTPSSELTVAGNLFVTGVFKDSFNATGTAGQVLSSTATGTQWINNTGGSTFLSLTDTQGSFTANRLIFTNSGGTALTDSADLTFDGTNLGIGASDGLSFGGTRFLHVDVADNVVNFGQDAGTNYGGINTVALGIGAGENATGTDNNLFGTYAGDSSSGSFANIFGAYAGSSNSGSNVNLFGQSAGENNTGDGNNIFGQDSGFNNSGDSNNIIGAFAGYENSGDNNNFIGLAAGYSNNGSDNEMIGYEAGRNLQSTTSIIIGRQSFRGTNDSAPFQAVNNVAIGYRTGYNATTSADNNILIGYQAADNLTSGANNIVIGYDVDLTSATGDNQLNIGNLIFGTGIDGTGTSLSSGNIGIGTTTPEGRLSLEKLNLDGAGVAGIDQYFSSINSSASAIQYGNRAYIDANNTATTTLIGDMLRIEDGTTFGNTVVGLEVQADLGSNTLGENTALSGFGRTFGVKGFTSGDAGGSYLPAGVFAETSGTTQGNAFRGYSSTITTASLLELFQASSTFDGTGLLMNFGNSGGSFSSTTASKFIDFQTAGTSMFTVGPYGMLTVGASSTSNNAGIQIGYGGLCVDNDGSCSASTTGRISSVSSHTGNSDLAEMYFSSEKLEAGEVVYLKGGLSVGRADEETKDRVIGVVSTKPGLLLGFDDESLEEGEEGYPLALSGRVPVKLSTENGPIKKGDELMLSSIPGVAMKATSTGRIIGVALEDFVETRAYSDTYINQFGDDIAKPVYTPIQNNDPRINDGCYYGGGNRSGEEPCVPLLATTTDEQVKEAEVLAEAEAMEEALDRLARERSERVTLSDGREINVGQVVMFVDLGYRYLDDDGKAMVTALLTNASSTEGESENESETIWQRLVKLANNFVDGVLSIFTLKADRVEVKDELCVDGVCLDADDLRRLLEEKDRPKPEPSAAPPPVDNNEEDEEVEVEPEEEQEVENNEAVEHIEEEQEIEESGEIVEVIEQSEENEVQNEVEITEEIIEEVDTENDTEATNTTEEEVSGGEGAEEEGSESIEEEDLIAEEDTITESVETESNENVENKEEIEEEVDDSEVTEENIKNDVVETENATEGTDTITEETEV